jgi:CheY-like chemotaxis protein
MTGLFGSVDADSEGRDIVKQQGIGSSNVDSVLFVDDAQDLLHGFQVMFQCSYEVTVAAGGVEGLAAIENHGAYSVVIADMRMPGMNGAEFLAQVRQKTPDSTRMLLTGNGDLASAIEAVNAGHIYSYLSKPCDKTSLTGAIEAGVKENRLLVAERELLEKTLMGNIKVLTEVLGATSPVIFGKSMRIARSVKHMAERLAPPSPWQWEAAASLSQLGCVTLPPDLIDQAYVGAKLSAEDQALYDTHPMVTSQLLAHIPRMEPVAWMIRQQVVAHKAVELSRFADDPALVRGAKVLRLATTFDAYRMRTLTDEEALSRICSREEEFGSELTGLLAKIEAEKAGMELRRVAVTMLETGMILRQEIRGKNGLLKVAKGQEITSALRIQLYNLVRAGVVQGHVLALVPV